MATYGLLNKNNIIENVLEFHPMNANEFPSAARWVMSHQVLRDEYRDGNFSRRDEQVKSTNTLFNEFLTSKEPEVMMTVLKEKEATEQCAR